MVVAPIDRTLVKTGQAVLFYDANQDQLKVGTIDVICEFGIKCRFGQQAFRIVSFEDMENNDPANDLDHCPTADWYVDWDFACEYVDKFGRI